MDRKLHLENSNLNLNLKNNFAKYFEENNENHKKLKKQIIICSNEILSKLCFVNHENQVILDTRYFLLMATKDNYSAISEYVVCIIANLLTIYETVFVHINMQSITLTHLDKHYNFIKNICILFQEKFPDKLEKCFVYNAPFLFSQLFKIVSRFIDKKTQKKIELVKE